MAAISISKYQVGIFVHYPAEGLIKAEDVF